MSAQKFQELSKKCFKLLCAKLSVFPTKPLAKLKFCCSSNQTVALNTSQIRSVEWIDSSVVLGCLKTPLNDLKDLVVNKVAKIGSLVE